MKHGHQRGLADIAQSLPCAMRERQPVVPATQGILQPFQFRKEPSCLRRFRREFGSIARPLYSQTIVVKRLFVYRPLRNGYAVEHLFCDRKRVTIRIESECILGPPEPLPYIANIVFPEKLAQTFFMPYTKFDQALHQLRLAPRFLRDLQPSQSFKLHINIAHFSGRLTNPVQRLQQLLMLPIRHKLLQKSLEAPCGCPEPVHCVRLVSGREPKKLSLGFSKDRLATVRRDRHSLDGE
jgi:hypothetical protein